MKTRNYSDEPLSIAQQSLWLIQNCSLDKAIYNGQFVWSLPDSVDIEIVKNIFQQLVDRHPILRTLFVPVDGQVVQRVYEEAELSFTTLNVEEMSDEDFSDQVLDKEYKTPIDLEKEYSMRWKLFIRPNTERVLSLVIQHIVSDVGSVMVFINEFRALYEAELKGQSLCLPELKHNYIDYINAQNAFISSEQGKEQEAYWINELQDVETSLNLPLDKKRPSSISCSTNYFNKLLPTDISERFNRFVGEQGLSLFGCYLSAYHILLNKYSGQKETIVGTPTGGRGGEFEGIFGFFANAVIIRSNIEDSMSILDYLQIMNKKVKNGIAAQNYPLSAISKKLNIDRDASKASLFQSTFVWNNINAFQNRDKPLVSWNHDLKRFWDMESAGVWEHWNRSQQLDDQDVTFKIYKFKNDYYIGIEYNSDLFFPETIERMAEHFQQILLEIAAKPEQNIGQLSLLTEQEKSLVQNEWNATEIAYSKDKFLHNFVEEYAQHHPDCIALRSATETLTYEALNEQANCLANYLIDLGIKQESIVGVAIDRNFDTIISILAIHKAGGAYLPLDPDYPGERLAYMVEDANVSTIITHTQLKDSLSLAADNTICLDTEWTTIEQLSSSNPNLPQDGSQLAYVIYTSGSTGKPKGVLVEQAQLCHHLTTLREVFDLSEHDRVLQFATLNFDASVMTYCMALQSGASLYLAPKETLLGEGLFSTIREQSLSCVMVPPSVLASMAPEHFNSLRYLMVAGEPVSADLAYKWNEVGHKLTNVYGPTECTVWATTALLDGATTSPIGKALANTKLYILDANMKPVPVGVPGELFIAGSGVTRGYLNRPDLTDAVFLPNPFSDDANSRLYKTGDLARFITDGNIECLGRIDHQIKIRGFRVELGEIESSIHSYPSVENALVMARDDMTGKGKSEPLLAAYIITNDAKFDIDDLRSFLKQKLPDYMIPSGFVTLDAFPLTPNEKIDRKALPIPSLGGTKGTSEHQTPRNEIEKAIAQIWQDVLNLQDVSTDENFFDLGGHSLLLAQVYSKFPTNLKNKLSMVDLFKYPTIKALAKHLEKNQAEEETFYLEKDEHIERMRHRRRAMEDIRGLKIAVVGMAGRFPGAESVDEFWKNILGKEEAIRFYSDEELLKDGVSKQEISHPNYVKAKGAISNPKGFDADFFAYSPREAQITDPQHRLFLECSYEALEDGGCVPETFNGKIGVYAGTGINSYLMNHISANPSVVSNMGDYPIMIGNDKDFLSTRVSYKLNLNGPAVVIQTACSTSLVAVHSACQALINEECDAALAGGVSLGKLDNEGYLYKEGMIMSPDGHCRAFDENAKGTILGQGAGVVLLKRLDDALRDNDHIYAVIEGSGVNNDGSAKSGYTAPSIEGQAKAIMLAHASANVSPDQITYVEAHGTGTALGDPIEIEGLNYAFNTTAQTLGKTDLLKTKACAIGSAKTNVGHMDAASGVAGFIKAAKALEEKILPPSLHFNKANPKISFDKTPFYVNTECQDWPKHEGGRHAGVSAFGIGGTNAHVVLGEAPEKVEGGSSRPWQILTLSAKTETALDARTEQLLGFLNDNPNVNFSDVCYSLHTGRKRHEYRRYLVCRNVDDAILELSKPDMTASTRIVSTQDNKVSRKLAFMFTGQGSQYVNMARTLYRVELTFRRVVDHCRTILKEKFVYLFERLVEDDFSALSDKVHDTYITQPTLFITEYALAKTLMSWNIKPDLMLGHSIGEYVAACLAGVFTLDQALELVTIRGRMIYDLEKGDMMMVGLSESEVKPYLSEQISLAAINGEKRCVVSGQSDAIITLQKSLNEQDISNRILHTSHAFHSHMMDEILEDFTNSVAKRKPRKPQKPFVSTMTGEMITDEQATSPEYWAKHLRNCVRFHQGLDTLLKQRENEDSGWILLEVGPGKVLSTLARQHPSRTKQDLVFETIRQSDEDVSDTFKLLNTVAKLWINNVEIDWEVYHSSRQRYKIPLPTYPFERLDYWVESGKKLRMTQDRRGQNFDQLPPLPIEKTEVKVVQAQGIEARDEIDSFICRLWEKTLGVDKVGIYDNYFDLGGDSLRAVSIIDTLVTEYKAPIPTHILIQKPSVALLSDHIKSITQHPEVLDKDNSDLRYTESLVTIQKGNERKQPLFMVHPIGGEVYFYRDLAHQLGADQPVFAFQATSLSGQTKPYTDVATMAADYISELKVIGAKPPYLLGGSSFGGLVAYEMAQQLKALGEEVRLLVMIDTPFPQEMPAHLTNSAAILDYLLKDKIPLSLERLNKLDPKDQIEYVLAEARMRGKSDLIPPHIGIPLFNTWIAHQEATFAYQPKNYTDDVVFFRHTEKMEHFPAAPHETWLDYIEGKVEIHQVPGNHITMNMNPCVNVLAAHLKIVLKNTAAQIQRDSEKAEANKLYPQSYQLNIA